MAGAAFLVLLALVAVGWRLWSQHRQARAEAEASRAALTALLAPEEPTDSAPPGNRLTATLAAWRDEFRDKRSRALQDYNFAEMAESLRDPRSPVAGKPEARIRAQVLQRVQTLFGWLAITLQKYNRERPLVVRELTGTAPKEIRVYAGPDRRLYYAEGGAIRQRNWAEVPPPALAAIIAGAFHESRPLPPREVALGALAFGQLYNLPELAEALRAGQAQRPKR